MKHLPVIALFALLTAEALALSYGNTRRTEYAVLAYENADSHAEGFASEMSAFSTYFNPGQTARARNIRLAADKLDGSVVEPGAEFSFNASLGPTDKGRGYLVARTFLRGKETWDYGGGVCQVSSTIHVAAIEAGMDVTERHAHTRKVRYVGDGLDAATSYGGWDLKFVNPYDFPVVINVEKGRGSVSVTITSYAE